MNNVVVTKSVSTAPESDPSLDSKGSSPLYTIENDFEMKPCPAYNKVTFTADKEH